MLRFVAGQVAMDDEHQAALAVGGLGFADDLWDKLHPPEQEPEEAEETFVDPGTIVRPEQ